LKEQYGAMERENLIRDEALSFGLKIMDLANNIHLPRFACKKLLSSKGEPRNNLISQISRLLTQKSSDFILTRQY
jgi:hypothetical protein